MRKLKPKTSLKIILFISVVGMLFSGYLSYTELFAGCCKSNLQNLQPAVEGVCKLGCSKVGSIPACVYGFFMYLVVFVFAVLGLRK